MDLQGDPRVEDWFGMDLYYPCGILFLYFMFTFYWGPQFMARRDHQPPDYILIINRSFNYMNVFLNLTLGLTLVFLTIKAGYSPLCQSIRPTGDYESQIARCIWLYYLFKILELTETAFIIFRDNAHILQQSLHVYHHVTALLITWIGLKYVPGGNTAYPVMINCFVHVIIYSTFLLVKYMYDQEKLAGVFQPLSNTIKCIQFTTIGLHSLWNVIGPGCGYSRWASVVLLCYMLSFLVAYGILYLIINRRNRR